MKKRLTAICLALLAALAAVPTAFAANVTCYINGGGSGPREFASLAAAIDAAVAEAGGGAALVTLNGDLDAGGQDARGTISAGETVILDLNGYTIRKSAGASALFVDEGGALTIRDSAGTGAIAGAADTATAAVTVYGGALTVEGGTIRDNKSTDDGGGVYVENGDFTMTGGAVTGNEAAEGGGIYAAGNSAVRIEGGVISDNRATGTDMPNSSPEGGGGIALIANRYTQVAGDPRGDTVYAISLTVTGGSIAGNYAEGGGGGISIRRGLWKCAPAFTMTGGSVTGNVANTREGGGIRFEGGTGVIDPQGTVIEISGNVSRSREDLGGGGVFVVNAGEMTIHNAVIRGNTAGGLGGGIAGCIHGSVADLSSTGAAIYGNTAEAVNFTTGTSGTPADDRDTVRSALESGVFTAADAQDFFTAGTGASLVGDRMPGGGSHAWAGVDGANGGTRVTVAPGSAYHSTSYLVLTAHPTEADRERAVDALQGGMVLIEDNRAENHGGGVAVNGVLSFGAYERDYNVAARVGLDITKTAVRVHDGTGTEEPLPDLAGYCFDLSTDETGQNVAATAVSGADGSVRLDIPADQFTRAGTYTFYLRERPGSDGSMVYDPAVYRVDVTVELTDTEEVGLYNNTFVFTIYHYEATSVVMTREGSPVTELTFRNEAHDTACAIGGTKEVNTGAPDTAFTFELLDEDGATVLDTASTTGAGSFQFRPLTYTAPGTHTYTVREVSGNETDWTYDAARYTVTVTVSRDADTGALTAAVSSITADGEPRPEIKFYNSYDRPGGGSTRVSVRVEKKWVLDDGGELPDSAAVTLLRDGEPYDTVTLRASDGWAHTWTGLSSRYAWTVEETDVPAGFASSVTRNGRTFTITNDDIPEEAFTAVGVEVVKKWVLDDGGELPDSATVTLLRDGEPYDTVALRASDGWAHTWTGLSSRYAWTVEETDVPAGFASSVTRNGRTFTITNDDIPEDTPHTPDRPDRPDQPTLPQTGQRWPLVWLLAAAGAALIGAGVLLAVRHRKKHGT